jgi:hypothetical protein
MFNLKSLRIPAMKNFIVMIALVAVGAIPLTSTAPAQGPVNDRWAGEWFREGNPDRPCAIFRQGGVLLLVNEFGQLGTGRVVAGNRIVARPGRPWNDDGKFAPGLNGELSKNGAVITWANNTTWKRP